MVDVSRKSAGLGHRVEQLHSMDSLISITGGGEFQRRYRRDYSKKAHKEHDIAAKEPFGLVPDISVPYTIGGHR